MLLYAWIYTQARPGSKKPRVPFTRQAVRVIRAVTSRVVFQTGELEDHGRFLS